MIASIAAVPGLLAARGLRVARSLRATGTVPWITLALVIAAIAVATLPQAQQVLAYKPHAPTLHALLACHVLHFSRMHLLWDVTTFAVLGACSERSHRGRYAVFLVLAMLLVPPIACALEPWVTRYAGLSGLVIGQVALWLAMALRAALTNRQRTRALTFGLLIVLLLCKQGYEYYIGNTSLIAFHYQGFSTVPSAHLVSTVLGLAVGLCSEVDHLAALLAE